MRQFHEEYETNSSSSDQVVQQQKGLQLKADHELIKGYETYLEKYPHLKQHLPESMLRPKQPKNHIRTPFFHRLEEVNEKIKVFNSLFYNKVPKYEQKFIEKKQIKASQKKLEEQRRVTRMVQAFNEKLLNHVEGELKRKTDSPAKVDAKRKSKLRLSNILSSSIGSQQ